MKIWGSRIITQEACRVSKSDSAQDCLLLHSLQGGCLVVLVLYRCMGGCKREVMRVVRA
jgi:hypothetical protein